MIYTDNVFKVFGLMRGRGKYYLLQTFQLEDLFRDKIIHTYTYDECFEKMKEKMRIINTFYIDTVPIDAEDMVELRKSQTQDQFKIKGGFKKIKYIKTGKHHTDNKGVTRVMYNKQGKYYVKIKNMDNGKFEWKLIK